MRSTLRGTALVLLTMVCGSAAAHAQTDTVRVTLREAERLALTRNPTFLADQQARDIATGLLRQARTYSFNPEIEFEAPNSISNGLNSYDAWLWQDIQWAGQRGLGIGAAEAGLSAANGFVADAARRTIAQVGLAFYAAVATQERVDAAEGLLVSSTRLLDAVRIQVAEGEISRMEENFAEIETGRTRALVLATRRQAASAALELGRLLGLKPDVPVLAQPGVEARPSGGSIDPDSLLQVALLQRPDLAARAADIRRLELTARLAGRSAVPNLRLGTVMSLDSETGETRWGFGVGLPLPLWNRNRGFVDANRAATLQASLARNATELLIRTQVEQSLQAYEAAEEEATIYETEVLEPARENQGLLDTAYREGLLPLTDLVLLRNQLLQAELGYWDVWLTLQSTWIDLTSAVGDPLDSDGDAAAEAIERE